MGAASHREGVDPNPSPGFQDHGHQEPHGQEGTRRKGAGTPPPGALFWSQLLSTDPTTLRFALNNPLVPLATSAGGRGRRGHVSSSSTDPRWHLPVARSHIWGPSIPGWPVRPTRPPPSPQGNHGLQSHRLSVSRPGRSAEATVVTWGGLCRPEQNVSWGLGVRMGVAGELML